MRFTDDTIDIECGECSEKVQGFSAMVAHIFDKHSEYSKDEQQVFAMAWLEDAYEREEENEKNYNEDRALDKAIHTDAFPNK